MVMSLDELKAQNEKEEQAENADTETEVLESSPEPSTDTETKAAEVETEESKEAGEPDSEETEDTEDWLKTDEKPQLFTSDQVRAARIKGQEKGARKAQAEIDQLRAENEELKKLQVTPTQQLSKPKYEDYINSDNPEAAYAEALSDYTIKTTQATLESQQAAQQVNEQQTQQAQKIDQSVNKHYERAAELAKNSKIDPETYQQADSMVRQAIESVFPNAGDAITDRLISTIGEGSEKVMYAIGVNAEKRGKLLELLREDPTGLSANGYLNRMAERIATPIKRKRLLPPPPDEVKGDEKTTQLGTSLKRKYNEAHKKGDNQTAFDLRRQARKSGVDISNW